MFHLLLFRIVGRNWLGETFKKIYLTKNEYITWDKIISEPFKSRQARPISPFANPLPSAIATNYFDNYNKWTFTTTDSQIHFIFKHYIKHKLYEDDQNIMVGASYL